MHEDARPGACRFSCIDISMEDLEDLEDFSPILHFPCRPTLLASQAETLYKAEDERVIL